MNQQQSMKVCLAAIIVILAIASVLVCAHTYRGGQYNNSVMTQAPPGQTKTELYQEMLITALDPYIQKSVTEYYGKIDGYGKMGVFAPPYVVQVMEATRPTADQTYDLGLEVEPYTGPHDEVGMDHITMRISPTEIDIVKFEHIKSFLLPPNLQPR
jgi:hypothetical protein